MAVITTSEVGAIINDKISERLAFAFNRSSVSLAALNGGEHDAPHIDWDVFFEDDNFAGGTAEGADVSTYSSDEGVKAGLTFAEYTDTFKITGAALRRANASTSPNAVANQFLLRLTECFGRLANQIETDFIDGNGSNKLLGLIDATNGAIMTSGTYAGIARASYAAWVGSAEDGGASAFDRDNIRNLRTKCYKASGFTPNFYMSSPDVFDAVEESFDSERRVEMDAMRVGDLNAKIAMAMGVDYLRIGGGYLFKNRSMADADGIIALMTDRVKIVSMPNPAMGSDEFNVNLSLLPEEQLKAAGRVPMRCVVKKLASDGNYNRYQVILYLANYVHNPRGCGRYFNFTI